MGIGYLTPSSSFALEENPRWAFGLKLLSILLWIGFLAYFRSYDQILFVLALARFVHRYRTEKVESREMKISLYVGVGLTMLGGFCAEYWGVTTGRWTYLGLEGRSIPLWIPFAWAGMYKSLYRVEAKCSKKWGLNSFGSKLSLTFLMAALIPPFFEIVAIQLGIWEYHMPHQFLGMPAAAVFLLAFFHSGIFLAMVAIHSLAKWPHEFYAPHLINGDEDSEAQTDSKSLKVA